MAIRRLSKGGVRAVERAVDDLFDRLKVRSLGPGAVPKRIIVTYNPQLTLRGLFEAAAAEEGYTPDEDVMHSVFKVAGNYLDAAREKAKAQVVNAVNAWIANTATGAASADEVVTVLGGALSEIWKNVGVAVERIIDTEASQARNISLMDGIVKVNALQGIVDPVVYFVVVRDERLCPECKRLHLGDDGKTPRVYLLSEIGQGYHKKGESDPKIGGLHPHCRCTMVTLLPGYGFDRAGMVSYISKDHDEYAKQRGLARAETDPLEPLLKAANWGLGDLERALAAFGWKYDSEGGDHKLYSHPTIPHKLAVKHEHVHGNITPYWIKEYGGQVGLKIPYSGNAYKVDPNDPVHAPYYARMGLVQLPAVPPADKMWKPVGDGYEQVPIHKAKSMVEPEGWKVDRYGAMLADPGYQSRVPFMTAMYDADTDEYHVDDAAPLEAARRHGYTHVPIRRV